MSLEMKLADFLKSHDTAEIGAKSLKLSLGDGFLYKNNPIFRNVRNRFLDLGFSYTDQDFCHYTVMPYLSLPQILKYKKVPYFDNVTVLKQIESMHPRKFKCAEIIKVKSNAILHESSHCLADFFLKKIGLDFLGLSKDSAKAFQLVMTESFANTIESLANFPNKTSEQRLFYALNSYVTHSKKINSVLEKTIDEIGLASTYSLVYVSYLFANCLLPEPSAKNFNEILSLLFKDDLILQKATGSSSVRKLFSHAFELSLDFRLKTTGFYCAYSGIETDFIKALQIDLLKLLKNSKMVHHFLQQTEKIITEYESD